MKCQKHHWNDQNTFYLHDQGNDTFFCVKRDSTFYNLFIQLPLKLMPMPNSIARQIELKKNRNIFLYFYCLFFFCWFCCFRHFSCELVMCEKEEWEAANVVNSLLCSSFLQLVDIHCTLNYWKLNTPIVQLRKTFFDLDERATNDNNDDLKRASDSKKERENWYAWNSFTHCCVYAWCPRLIWVMFCEPR